MVASVALRQSRTLPEKCAISRCCAAEVLTARMLDTESDSWPLTLLLALASASLSLAMCLEPK